MIKVRLDYEPQKNIPVSSFIKDANNYYMSWDNDPTIKSMLVMLDAISYDMMMLLFVVSWLVFKGSRSGTHLRPRVDYHLLAFNFSLTWSIASSTLRDALAVLSINQTHRMLLSHAVKLPGVPDSNK